MRTFVARGMELLVAQSYSKNLGLYAERIGAINVVCSSPDAATRYNMRKIQILWVEHIRSWYFKNDVGLLLLHDQGEKPTEETSPANVLKSSGAWC